MFLYVVETPRAPAHVALQLPPGWKIATSLVPTSDEGVFYACSAEALADSPILAGNLHEHRFQVQGAPVRVAYWPAPDAKPIDENALVGSIEKIVRGGAALFGGPPWREYVFQIRDGARGALEHADSVTVGVSSAELAANPHAADGQVAHEFFHAWNMMRIRSAEYRASITDRSCSPAYGSARGPRCSTRTCSGGARACPWRKQRAFGQLDHVVGPHHAFMVGRA